MKNIIQGEWRRKQQSRSWNKHLGTGKFRKTTEKRARKPDKPHVLIPNMTLEISCSVQCMKSFTFLHVMFGKFEEGRSVGSGDK